MLFLLQLVLYCLLYILLVKCARKGQRASLPVLLSKGIY